MRATTTRVGTLFLAVACHSTGEEPTTVFEDTLRSGQVPVGDSFLHYDEAGAGPVLLFVHGGQTDRRMWEPQFRAFSADHRVVRYDVRGFGRSGDVVEPYASHHDLQDLVEALDLGSFTLVGLSLGGRIAIDYALDHPERVEKLVLAAPGVTGWNWSGEEHAFFGAITAAAAEGNTARAVELWLECPYMLPAMERQQLAGFLTVLASDNERAWRIPPVEQRRQPPATEELEGLDVPTLLILGDRDVPDIQRIADTLEARVPGLERVDLVDVGHMPNLEAPLRFDHALRSFLAVKSERPYLEAARSVGAWIEGSTLRTEHGAVWPVEPSAGPASDPHLYSGSPGVVLFLLELARATGEDAALDLARAGADQILASLPSELSAENAESASLYTGVAGHGFVLLETWRSTGQAEYRAGAELCAELLHAAAIESGAGVRWSEITDIVSGAAGSGLFLLASAEQLGRPEDRELAVRAGHWLLEVAREEEVGRSWAMSPTFPRVMPNFSHGTAGVCYFLATLHGETGDEAFLTAALEGTRHLQSLADPAHDGFRVHHHTPGGEELYYLGWCHGPTGSSRLFERLSQVTGDGAWQGQVDACMRTLLQADLPRARPAGLWNNVSQCCGTAGVAELAIALEEMEFAELLARDLLARAELDAAGMRWIQAEHRVQPDLLQAQTGYMQGAAGIGLLLLHLDGALAGREERIRFPEDPWGARTD